MFNHCAAVSASKALLGCDNDYQNSDELPSAVNEASLSGWGNVKFYIFCWFSNCYLWGGFLEEPIESQSGEGPAMSREVQWKLIIEVALRRETLSFRKSKVEIIQIMKENNEKIRAYSLVHSSHFTSLIRGFLVCNINIMEHHQK